MGNRKRYPYTKELTLTKVGTGAENLDDNLVKTGRVFVLTNIAVEDETTALTKVRIGKVSAGKFYPWEEQQNPAAAELSFSTEEHWIREGEHFRAVITGGAASDVCKAYLDGYWFEQEEAPQEQ